MSDYLPNHILHLKPDNVPQGEWKAACKRDNMRFEIGRYRLLVDELKTGATSNEDQGYISNLQALAHQLQLELDKANNALANQTHYQANYVLTADKLIDDLWRRWIKLTTKDKVNTFKHFTCDLKSSLVASTAQQELEIRRLHAEKKTVEILTSFIDTLNINARAGEDVEEEEYGQVEQAASKKRQSLASAEESELDAIAPSKRAKIADVSPDTKNTEPLQLLLPASPTSISDHNTGPVSKSSIIVEVYLIDPIKKHCVRLKRSFDPVKYNESNVVEDEFRSAAGDLLETFPRNVKFIIKTEFIEDPGYLRLTNPRMYRTWAKIIGSYPDVLEPRCLVFAYGPGLDDSEATKIVKSVK